MTLLQHRNFSARLRSGLFAFIFAPVALVFLGSSMVDVQALASVGQPLASVEGLIGMALASMLIALIALNCEESSAGMVVTFVWSLVVGAAQFLGVARLPLLMKSSVGAEDMFAGVLWCLYPVCLSLMLGACALTIKSVRVRAGKDTRIPLARVHRVEKQCGCDPTPSLDAGLMSATLAWAHGSTLATAIDGADIQAGDFVRWMRQVMDCLGQIASAAPASDLARRAEAAKDRIGRGIVAWSTI